MRMFQEKEQFSNKILYAAFITLPLANKKNIFMLLGNKIMYFSQTKCLRI